MAVAFEMGREDFAFPVFSAVLQGWNVIRFPALAGLDFAFADVAGGVLALQYALAHSSTWLAVRCLSYPLFDGAGHGYSFTTTRIVS